LWREQNRLGRLRRRKSRDKLLEELLTSFGKVVALEVERLGQV
jgi:hypothetical protein